MSKPTFIYIGYTGGIYPVDVDDVSKVPVIAKRHKRKIGRIHDRTGACWTVKKSGEVVRDPATDATPEDAVKMFQPGAFLSLLGRGIVAPKAGEAVR